MSDNENETKTEVNVTQSKINHFVIPDFWSHNPELWFFQIESSFETNKVSNAKQKFDYVVSKLPREQIEKISDVILKRDADDPYKHLKNAIVTRNRSSTATNFERLINEDHIGDRDPSVHLRKITDIATKCGVTDQNVIKTFWLRSLPNEVKAIISVIEDQAIDKLAAAADKANDLIKPRLHVTSVSNPSTALSTTSNFDAMVETITQKVTDNLRRELFAHRSRDPIRYYSPGSKHVRFSRNNSRGRNASVDSRHSQTGSSKKKICYYHHRFGDKATKCKPDCTYSKTSKN